MRSGDVDYRYDQATSRARDYAQSLGINAEGMNATQLSRAINAAVKQRSFDHNRSILIKLLDQGLRIGSLVKGRSFWGWVYRLHQREGTMNIRLYPTGTRFLRTVEGIELIAHPPETDSFDLLSLDAWMPPGFREIPWSLAGRILAGEFGEEVKHELKVRDSFFSRGRETRRHFLFETSFQRIQGEISKAKQEKFKQREAESRSYREQKDRKFCAQCGKEMVRPPDLSVMKWNNQLRCNDCQVHPVVFAGWKHCLSCGMRFSREETESGGAWGGRKKCRSCRARAV